MSRNALKKNTYRLLALWSLLLRSQVLLALPEDRYQLAHLAADVADLNQKTHYGEYHGNVQLDQGTTHLRAATAQTQANAQNKLLFAFAKGDNQEQAHYWVKPAINKPTLHAFADAIRYYPQRHLIELIGNARIVQGNNSFSAPKIHYNMRTQHIVSQTDGKTRTTIIVYPESVKDEKTRNQERLSSKPPISSFLAGEGEKEENSRRKKHE